MFTKHKYHLYSGIGKSTQGDLVSFDNALICAGVGNYNLVKVSSIVPPQFEDECAIDVPVGNILYTAYAALSEKGVGTISAAVGLGIPEDESSIGVIMEYSCHGFKVLAEERVRAMVISAMETRNILTKKILVLSSEAELSHDKFTTVIAGVALW